MVEKQHYIAPEAESVQIDGARPLCGSPGGDTESYGRGGSYGDEDFQ